MISETLGPFIANWPEQAQIAAIAIAISLMVFLRYGLLAGLGFGISQAVRKLMPWRRLQPRPFTAAQIRREILHSALSVVTFTIVIGLIVLMSRAGWTQIYYDSMAYGAVWFWLQIPVALMIQDLYFYWMHRAIHSPGLYERVHKVHHLSTNPSAFAAFAFHPLEAFLEIAIFVVIIMVIPMTPLALIAVGILSLIYNIYGHLGYEVMPRFIAKSPLGSILNKSAYHNQHHRTYRYNYGLYTVIWDRLHGTFHPHAERLYDTSTMEPRAEDAVTPS